MKQFNKVVLLEQKKFLRSTKYWVAVVLEEGGKKQALTKELLAEYELPLPQEFSLGYVGNDFYLMVEREDADCRYRTTASYRDFLKKGLFNYWCNSKLEVEVITQ